MPLIFPNTLNEGDKVAIISPATTVKEEYIDNTVDWLHKINLHPIVMPHAKGPRYGSYSATLNERLEDWLTALSNPAIKAILCTRGGYGCVHLAANTPIGLIRKNPKWVIGYSDVSALHALMYYARVASIHGPMAKHISQEGEDHYCTKTLQSILTKALPVKYQVENHIANHTGRAKGILLGGNMQVLNNLAGSNFDLLGEALKTDVILFLEDIHEPIYAVERMLTRLWLSGILSSAKGLIFGRFTDYKPDANFSDMNSMLIEFFNTHNVGEKPIAFNFPIGHLADNLPMIEGADCILDIPKSNISPYSTISMGR